MSLISFGTKPHFPISVITTSAKKALDATPDITNSSLQTIFLLNNIKSIAVQTRTLLTCSLLLIAKNSFFLFTRYSFDELPVRRQLHWIGWIAFELPAKPWPFLLVVAFAGCVVGPFPVPRVFYPQNPFHS